MKPSERLYENGTIERRRRNEAGVALILALMSLVVLTFLGLTLAATTSTELQIATNFRWGQQAYYNAEAGMAVGRWALSQLPNWDLVLPPLTPGQTWTTDPNSCPRCGTPVTPNRDYENAACDIRGGGVGFGVVLNAGGVRYQDITNVPGLGNSQVNGAFTIWIRRSTITDTSLNPAVFQDDPDPAKAIMTVEGAAPYIGDWRGNALSASNQAVRYLESEVTSSLLPCCDPGETEGSQDGTTCRQC